MNTIWLNTAFSARQAGEVAEREGVELLVHDAEFTNVVSHIAPSRGRLVCMPEDPDLDDLERLLAEGDPALPPPPPKARTDRVADEWDDRHAEGPRAV